MSSTACWNWGARSPSASPDSRRGWGNRANTSDPCNTPAVGNKTVGADKNYDTAAFVTGARALEVTPHVAQNITAHRGSNIDGRTTRHDGYRVSQVIRKWIEEANGWIKEVGGMAQTKLRGLKRVGWMFTLKAAAYNLIRLSRLLATG